MTVGITAGMKLTPARLNNIVFARKTADETLVGPAAALQNDDALVVSAAANTVYAYHLHAVYNSNATANFQSSWTLPASATMPANTFLCAGSGANVQHGTYSGTLLGGVTGLAADAALDLWGLVVVSSTAGTVQWRWAQNTANASNTIVRAGSYLLLTRVA